MKIDVLRVTDGDLTVAVEITGPPQASDTLARELVPDLAKMTDGKMIVKINDVSFDVFYEQSQAVGDNGRPVRGDVTGEYTMIATTGIRAYFGQHVSPHGTSGYGNAHAKGYAAEQVAKTLIRCAAQRTPA